MRKPLRGLKQPFRRAVTHRLTPLIIAVGVLMSLLMAKDVKGAERALEGIASWYSVESCQREGTSGVWTASGLAYNNEGMTAAMPSYEFYGWYKVTNRATGASVVVLHNDYGPNAKLVRAGRVIDLSPAAFREIASLDRGLIRVTVERIR